MFNHFKKKKTKLEMLWENPNLVKLDIGCGNNKKQGFIGIDIYDGEGIDHVLDMEKDRLPFDDDSVDFVFSNHAFEHITAPQNILREIVRVCKHKAMVEIWTPYLKSNDAFLLGHDSFYNENIWKHICYLYDDFYFGDTKGRFELKYFQYILYPQIEKQLEKLNIPFVFALDHMFNIALEFAAVIEIDKTVAHAKNPQIPGISVAYSRNMTFMGKLKHQFLKRFNHPWR